MRRFGLTALLWALLTSTATAIDAYEFSDPAEEQQFRKLTAELRCPKCQNQNIADSNAPLAADLRQKVYDLTRAGNGYDDIVDYMKQRYGDFVTYRPPLNPVTAALWFGPLALILAALALLALWVRRRQRVAAAPPPLSADERARLDALLKAHAGPADAAERR